MSNHLVEVKVWGRYACFTRPENKVERLSYPIITPSAAVGVLEAIYWKPQFRWEVTEIGVLCHPDRGDVVDWQNYMPITLNELAAGSDAHPEDGYNLQEHRVQRTCLVLRWPCYVIRARAKLLSSTTNLAKIRETFEDRVKTGRCHHQPYLGLREFVAFFGPPVAGDVAAVDINEPDLGMIMHSVCVPQGERAARYNFVPLRVDHGVFVPRRGVTK